MEEKRVSKTTYGIARPRANSRYLYTVQLKCHFCESSNVDRLTLTCRDCNTTFPDQQFERKRVKKDV